MNTPIALFTYARPSHTKHTVEALLRNIGIGEHDLIVYSDAPHTPNCELFKKDTHVLSNCELTLAME
jgi:hypothetical protein